MSVIRICVCEYEILLNYEQRYLQGLLFDDWRKVCWCWQSTSLIIYDARSMVPSVVVVRRGLRYEV